MKWRPYPKYKPSGVEWLGDVPEHWEVKRGRFCMYVNPRSKKLPLLDLEDEVSFVPMEAIGEYGGVHLIEQTRSIADIGSGYTEFDDGDVIVAKITPCFENGKGALAAALKNGAAFGTTEIHVLRARQGLDNRLLFYLTISTPFRSQGEGSMYGAGGQKRVPPEFCKDFCIPLPPTDEQTAIADFLDRETLKIDTLVVKKQTLIERLKEKRTALITALVTGKMRVERNDECGMMNDENGNSDSSFIIPHSPFKMKPSGVEWLGDVPEGWEVKSIKRLTIVQRGASPRPIDNEIYFDDNGEYSWVRISDVTTAGMYLTSTTQCLSELGSSLSVPLEPGTLFLSIAGSVGKPCITKIRCCIHDGFVYFPHWRGEARFLYYVFASGEPYKGLGKLGTQLNLNTDTVGSIIIGIPDEYEQTAIANFLDRETAKIDQLIAKIETAIERLREYRIALITAAVTGKIDVRREAA